MFLLPKVFRLVRKGNAAKLRAYLSANPDELERIGPNGRTPLVDAAFWMQVQSLNVILEFEPNINAQSEQGNTALHLAASQAYTPIAEKLLERSARTDIKNNNGEYAKNIALTSVMHLFTTEDEEPTQQKNLTSEFQKQSEYSVSYTDIAAAPALTMTALYNFKAKTVCYISAAKGSAPNVQPLLKAASKEQLQEAAEYLQAHGGNICGFKLPAII